MKQLIDKVKTGEITSEHAIAILVRLAQREDYLARKRQIPVGDVESVQATDLDELFEIIATLPARQRQCVWLYFKEKLNQVEIAEVLGIPQANVSIHLRAAREALAKRTERDNWHELMSTHTSPMPHSEGIVYPYEIWANWYVGLEQSRNGQWVQRFDDRLRQYVDEAFGPDVCLPGKY